MQIKDAIGVIKNDKQWDLIAVSVSLIAVWVSLLPFLILGDEYIFTVHDYLDGVVGSLRIIQKLPLFPSYEESSGVMCEMPSVYFFPEFNVYRFLHYYFDFVFADFLNRMLAVIIGFFSTKYLLECFFKQYLPHSIIILIATTYAISPVYPLWSLGFATLPLLIAKLFKYWNSENEKITWRMLGFLLVGFFGTFACLGLFVCFLWGLMFIAYLIRYRRVNKPIIVGLILMSISYGITNIHLFMMAFSGVETNRLLMGPRETTIGKELYYFVREFWKGLFHGQYHAKPIIEIVAVSCALGGAKIYSLFRQHKLTQVEIEVAEKLWMFFLIMCGIAMIYSLDESGIIRKVFSIFMPILGGFYFERLLYLNNIFWYILFAGIMALFIMHYKLRPVFFLLVVLQLSRVLFSWGAYRNTTENIFYSYFINRPNTVSYRQFIDHGFWTDLKEKICYTNEKVICVGFHPSVAIANDFNTMDGYLSLHPMEYHKAFREIIAPTLKRYDSLREYYDTWGGRMYVFVDSTRNVEVVKDKTVEYKELYIDTDAFKKQGGKYILSRYVLTNAADLHFKMITECDKPNSIYHIFVYQVMDV